MLANDLLPVVTIPRQARLVCWMWKSTVFAETLIETRHKPIGFGLANWFQFQKFKLLYHLNLLPSGKAALQRSRLWLGL